MTNKYLLEIGVEELPATYVEDGLGQLKENMGDFLKEEKISVENIKTYGTPRRLTIILEGLSSQQETRAEVLRGPGKKIAYDSDGNPSKALLGFMRGQNLQIDNIFIDKYNDIEYVFANVEKKAKQTSQLLVEKLPDLIKSIQFPKTMKWGGKNLRFARPIRWLVSILNDEVLEFELEGIVSSNITKGHRFLGSSNIKIPRVDDYISQLEENYVIVDQDRRRDIIRMSSEKLTKEIGGSVVFDEDLLEEVTYLVEYPTPLLGNIREEYLDLPQDVVITPMKEHLKYFPVVNDKKQLLPYFITVRNGNSDYINTVRKGNEKVLGARLEDAKFFFNEDLKTNLDDNVEKLKHIVFHEKLGTLYDKTKRVEKLAKKIGDLLEVGEKTQKNINRATYLSKADLTTKMVGEFTELQGKMGSIYSQINGENEIVSSAIFEQYLPRYANDKLPKTTAGTVLSIADKLDTIVGFFAIGIQPTGSQDPFGLRRQALGIINIILEKILSIRFYELIDYSLYIYVEDENLVFDYKDVKSDLIKFFNGRIRNIFSDKGIRFDVIDSILSIKKDDIADLNTRAEKINKWVNQEEIDEVLATFKRVANLAEKSESVNINYSLLQEDEEVDLVEAFEKVEKLVSIHLLKNEYDRALEEFVSLKEPVNKFFDNIMVMVEDEEIRLNRLALIGKIYATMLEICDLSKIVK